jgi:hypothetical protein
MADAQASIKQLRYQVMLALYLPILLYSFSTFDVDETTVAVKEVQPVLVGEETIILGQEFRADAYLTAVQIGTAKGKEGKAGGLTVRAPEGSGLMVEEGNQLVMSTGGLLADDEEEKVVEYSAELQYPNIEGGIESKTVAGRFRVRRPEVVAQSAATEALYRQTRNSILINVPGLEGMPLRTQVGNGSKQNSREVTISPSGETVTVKAYLAREDGEGDVYLGQKEFSVIQPPKPQVRILSFNGAELTSGDAIPPRFVFTFEADPDDEYQRRYPEDARYAFSRAKVSIRKGKTATREVGTYNIGGDGRLSLARQLASEGLRGGDQLLIELQGVSRVNHAGQRIPVDLSKATRTFGFTIAG